VQISVRPGAAMDDEAYFSAANRAYLRRRGIKAVIPVKDDQKPNRRKRGSRGAARLRPRTAADKGHDRHLTRPA
jgi:hypothetical protein